MTDDLKICDWALNSEYFTTIMHALRDDPSYRAIVDLLVEVRSQGREQGQKMLQVSWVWQRL